MACHPPHGQLLGGHIFVAYVWEVLSFTIPLRRAGVALTTTRLSGMNPATFFAMLEGIAQALVWALYTSYWGDQSHGRLLENCCCSPPPPPGCIRRGEGWGEGRLADHPPPRVPLWFPRRRAKIC